MLLCRSLLLRSRGLQCLDRRRVRGSLINCVCDRIAIVDRGELLELDTPEALKRRAPGGTLVEISLSGAASDVVERVRGVEGVLGAEAQGATLRVYSDRGGRVISPVIASVEDGGVTVTNISLTEPSLETLFVSRTGRKLD